MAFRFRHEPMEDLEEGGERLRRLIAEDILPSFEKRSPLKFIAPPQQTGATSLPLMKEPIQRHNHLEIGIIVEGTMGMWWRGQLDICGTGTVLLIPPHCPHFPHVPLTPYPPPHRVLWLSFPSRQCIAHQCAWRDNVHYYGSYQVPDDESLVHLGQMIWQEWQRWDEWSPAILRGIFFVLMGRILKAPLHPPSPKYEKLRGIPRKVKDPLIRDVHRFLWRNYHRPLKLSDLAAAFHVSPFYLHRRFREVTGETPLQALRRIRIEVAKHLLCLDFSLTTVSDMTGFSDPFYFSKVFTRFVGIPPSVYRRQYGGRCNR